MFRVNVEATISTNLAFITIWEGSEEYLTKSFIPIEFLTRKLRPMEVKTRESKTH